MNPQVAAAYNAINKDAVAAEQVRLTENARCQVVATARMRIAQSDAFAEIKNDAERLIADNESLLLSSHEPYLMFQAQGAIWGLHTLLDHYEKAEAELKHLEAEAQETAPE